MDCSAPQAIPANLERIQQSKGQQRVVELSSAAHEAQARKSWLQRAATVLSELQQTLALPTASVDEDGMPTSESSAFELRKDKYGKAAVSPEDAPTSRAINLLVA